MHNLAYLNKQKIETGKREMQKRIFEYEDVEWEKLLCENLLYIERYKLTIENKLRKKTSLVSTHIKLAEVIGSVSTGKDTSGS